MYPATRRAPSRRRRFLVGAVGIALVGGTLTAAAIATDTFGAGDLWLRVVNRAERFMAGPVPDRPTIATVKVTEPPDDPESPAPEPTPIRSTAEPGQSPTATPE